MTLVFDGHNDALLRLARGTQDPAEVFASDAPGHISLPKAARGGFAGGFFAMFALDDNHGLDFAIFDNPPYDTPLPPQMPRDVAAEKIARQVEVAHRLEAAGHVRFARSADAAVLEGPGLLAILHLEGAEAIGPEGEGLDALCAAGLRSIGPVWSRPTAFAHGVPFRFPSDGDTGPGLTPEGKALAREIKRRSMVLDTSHMAMKGFWDVADEGLPLVATHSNAHAISPSARNLTDAQLQAIGQTGGMVGLNFGTMFLHPDGGRGGKGALDHAIRHLDQMIAQAGEDHVGLGSDFDGAPMPDQLQDAGALPNLVALMRAHGYGETLIEKLCHENWLSFLRRTLPKDAT